MLGIQMPQQKNCLQITPASSVARRCDRGRNPAKLLQRKQSQSATDPRSCRAVTSCTSVVSEAGSSDNRSALYAEDPCLCQTRMPMELNLQMQIRTITVARSHKDC